MFRGQRVLCTGNHTGWRRRVVHTLAETTVNLAQPGKPRIASTPIDATLNTINARIRFSKTRAYGPVRSSRSAISRAGPVTARVARNAVEALIGMT
jgi:hypothetical protein